MNKKRPAPAGTVSLPALNKKRKTDNMQKFYAVKAGFKPGVYLSYADCQKQTAGFKGAVCESRPQLPPWPARLTRRSQVLHVTRRRRGLCRR